MQTEFVNVFIEKQREHLTDFMSRVIMSETKMHFLEKEIEQANATVKDLTEKLENANDKADQFAEQIMELKDQQDKKKKEFDQIENDLRSKLENAEKGRNELSGSLNACQNDVYNKQLEMDRLVSANAELNNQNTRQQEEAESLRSQINTLTAEMDSIRLREQTMAADYQKLSADYEELKIKEKNLAEDHRKLSAEHESLNTKYEKLAAAKAETNTVLNKTKK